MRPTAFYDLCEDGYIGTDATQSGWDDSSQHGGAVAGLLTRAIERCSTLVPMQLVRLTFDLIRPVPVGRPLEIDVRILREGKKIQLAQAAVLYEGTELARATGLRIRRENLTNIPGLPESTADPVTVSLPAPADTELASPLHGTGQPGLHNGIELRQFLHGDGASRGRAYWSRVTLPLVAGEDNSDLVRLAMTADFTNNIGVAVTTTAYSAMNPDLTIQIVRPPSTEWLAVVGRTWFDHEVGSGTSVAEIRDLDGICAIGTTSKIVQPGVASRPAPRTG